MLRGEHLGDRLAGHDIAELNRVGIGFPVVHPAAHVRVERQVLHAEEQLPGRRLRQGYLLQPEIGQLRPAFRPGGEDDLSGDCHVEVSS